MNKGKLVVSSIVVVGVAVALLESPLFKKDIEKKVIVGADKLNDIEINTTSANINVIPSNSEYVTITVVANINTLYGVEDRLHIYEQETKLCINYPVSKRNNIFNRHDTILTIEVPQQELHSLEVNATSGDIQIDNMHVKQIAIYSQSGDQIITNTKAKKQITTKTTSGDVKAENIQAEHAIFVVNSGDITLDNGDLKTNMDLTTSSGDVALTFDETPTSMRVNFESNLGKLYSSIDDLNLEKIDANHVKGIKGTGTYEVKVQTKSGDLNLA